MGAADFNTGALIKGTTEEIVAAVNIFKKYATEKHEQYVKERNCAYLQSCYISYDGETGLGARVNNMTDEEIAEFAVNHNHSVIVSASGPYGRFGFLSEVGLFKKIAETVPHATISGGMSGFNPGGDQIASYELKDGLLICKYVEGECEDWDEEDEDWDDYDEDDFEEPEWDYEEIYDPIAKKIVKG